MNRKLTLPKALYYISTAAYYIWFVWFGFLLIVSIIRWNRSEFADVGFDVPVNIQYHNTLKSDSNNKTLFVNKLNIYKSGKLINNEFDFSRLKETSYTQGTLQLNPDNKVYRLILSLNDCLLAMVITFITWQASRFFKQLSTKFVFDDNLRKTLNTIGYSLIIFEAIKLLVSLVNMCYVSKAENVLYNPSLSGEKAVLAIYTTKPDVSLLVLFISVALLCTSRLLAYGHELQQENELTI